MTFPNLDQDKEILAPLRSNSDTSKSNTRLCNSKSKKSKLTVSLESVKIDPKLMFSSESSMDSKTKTSTPRKSRSKLLSKSLSPRVKLLRPQESWLDSDNNQVLMTKLTSTSERRSLIKRDSLLSRKR